MRLFIIDDHDLVREALQARLELMADVEVVGSAADGAAALVAIERARPDLVILDFHMPTMNGDECARRIKEMLPECRILFLTGFPEDERLLDAAGLVSGYVTKSASWALLEQALDAIKQGKAFVDPNMVPAIMQRAAAADPQQQAMAALDPDHLLTPMEGRVAALAARGRTNQQIGLELGMSENTVKAHLQHTFRKLEVHTREELGARLPKQRRP